MPLRLNLPGRPRHRIPRAPLLLLAGGSLVVGCRPARPPATTPTVSARAMLAAPANWRRIPPLSMEPRDPAFTAKSAVSPAIESEISREVNLARAHPEIYAAYLETWLPLVNGTRLQRPGRNPWALHEGRPAIEEAIRYLRAAQPQPPLALADGMSLGADDLVRDHGPRGEKGHVGSDGSRVGDRLRRHGSWAGKAAEVVQYGANSAREIVGLLLVDDGVPDRGHRSVLFDSDYRALGVAVGSHSHYRTMCVITLAAEYQTASGTPGDSKDKDRISGGSAAIAPVLFGPQR